MSALVSTWLELLSKGKDQFISLWPEDYNALHKLTMIPPEKVIRGSGGEPRIFILDRNKCIETLKNRYNFQSKEEATATLIDCQNQEERGR